MLHDRDVWVFAPLVGNAVLLAATAYAGPTSLPYDSVSCVLVALFASSLSFVAVLGYIVHDIGPAKSFMSMTMQSIIVCMIYTLIYFHGGVGEKDLTFGQALYFSVVTWTSLGYENLLPSEDVMVIAALEAITGYVFLGLLISLLASLVGRATAQPRP